MHKCTKENTDTERHNDIMTLKDVADYLHIERKAVKNLMDNYGLPYVEVSSRPIYRFHRSSVDKWFHNREQQSTIC